MTTMTIECQRCGGKGEIAGSEFYRGRYWTIWLPCHTCHETGQITVEVEVEAPATPAVTPAPAGTLVVGGVTVHAPSFVSAEQFDAAVHRAYCEGLTVRPAATRGTVLVSNPTTHRAYLTTRTSCTCAAGRQGRACKHQAFAIHLASICGEDITRPQVAA